MCLSGRGWSLGRVMKIGLKFFHHLVERIQRPLNELSELNFPLLGDVWNAVKPSQERFYEKGQEKHEVERPLTHTRDTSF